MANANLTNAKKAKNDEFYTQYHDIEKEVNAYLEYNPDVFKGKTILLPCDDPEWSNFTKYFAQNFERFGLKKLISTSYASDSKLFKSSYQPTLFETEDPQFDVKKTKKRGKIFTLERDVSGDGKINVEDLEWNYLKGDWDFRSDEVKSLRDEADIIITNPPFSLFRQFLVWLTEANNKFLIIWNLNAITYKEVFPLIKENKVWLGNNYKVNWWAMFYEIPEELADLTKTREIKTNQKWENIYITRVQWVRWFTNIEHWRLHEKIPLMTESDIIKFTTKKPFLKYDNYNAIEVSLVKNIPSDYDWIMGVPISVMDKYSPDQFIILGTNDNWLIDDKYKTTPGLTKKFVEDYYKDGGTWSYKEGNPTAWYYNENNEAKMAYKRIFIKHKR